MNTSSPFSSRTLTQITSIRNREARATLIGAVKEFGNQPAPISAVQIKQLFQFEAKSYAMVQADKRWFFANPNDPESGYFARDLAQLHAISGTILSKLIERRAEWSPEEESVEVIRVLALALFHFAASFKWSFYRAEPVKVSLWRELHALYSFSELARIAHQPVQLFEGTSEPAVTAESLYLRALLLDALNTGSLAIAQIQIADSWLAEWTAAYAIESQPSPDSPLVVDLDAMAGLQFAPKARNSPSLRGVNVGALKSQLEAVRASLRIGQPYLTGASTINFAIEEHIALLAAIDRLRATLGGEVGTSFDERKQMSDANIEAHIGFPELLRALGGRSNAKPEIPMMFGEFTLSLESATSDAAEAEPPVPLTLRVKDQSAKGVGVIVDRVLGARVEINEIFTYRALASNRWQLGVVVRKVFLPAADEFLLGVEQLCALPLLLPLQHASEGEGAGDARILYGVYLPGADRDGKNDQVLLPAGDFERKNLFVTSVDSQEFHLRVNRVSRKGTDWLAFRFEVVKTSALDLVL